MDMTIFKNAEWIWNEKTYTENEYSEFVDTFSWNGEKVMLRISVCGDYTLFINGKFITSNQYADFPHYKVYDEIDITNFLAKGENRLGFLVWYFGKSGMRYLTPNPGLIYEIEVDGEIVSFSNKKTLSRKSPAYVSGSEKKISPQLGYSFTYDAKKEDDWRTDYKEDFTESCVIAQKSKFYKRPTEKLVIDELVKGKIMASDKSIIIDLGREIVGLPSFKLTTAACQKINIAYGEILENGHVKRIIGPRDFSFDYLTKAGENEYTNYMFRFAARFIEITSPEPISVEYAGLLPQSYPALAKDFSWLSGIDKEIYEICLNSLKLCMMEHYVDCPWREQCLYAYDSRNQMFAGYIAFEEKNKEYARANLLLMSKDQRKDNFLSICFPSNEDLAIPSFSLYYILAVKEYMENTGDLSLGEEVIEKIESILGAYLKNIPDGLVTRKAGDEYWNFYDWSEYCVSTIGGNDSSPDLIINCIVLLALESYEQICRMLGRKMSFTGIADRIRTTARDAFYNPEKEQFFITSPDEEPTELVHSLAVITGVADGEIAEKICEKLASGAFLPCSLSMKAFKYDAMFKMGKEKYRDAILGEIRTIYKIMLDSGLGTVWETIDGAKAFDNAGSLCHGWSAIPIYYFDLFRD